jgi:arylsulfatase A-like enzyme
MRRLPALLVLAALAGCRPDCTPQGGGTAPIVLLVTVDTLRADHVDGDPARRLARTPNLDRLGSDGARFTAAYSAANVTVPSHLSLLTSRPMAAHGVTDNHDFTANTIVTLPAVLSAAGYRTAAFVSALHLGRTMMFGRLLPGLERFEGPERASKPFHAEETVDRLLPWLREACRGPAFAWVHLWDPHMPYMPPAPFDHAYYSGDPRQPGTTSIRDARLDWVLFDTTTLRRELMRRPALLRRIKRSLAVNNRRARQLILYPNVFLTGPAAPEVRDELFTAARAIHPDLRDHLPYNRNVAGFLTGVRDAGYPTALYAGEVSYVDRELGRLRDTLDAWGLADRTVLVVTGDHGEGLGDHGVYFNHIGLWEEMIKVPLLVWAPGRVAPAVRQDLASGLDVAPTMLGLVNVAAPAAMEGRDLFAPAVEPRPIVTEAAKAAQITLRDGPWKLVRTMDAVWANEAFYRQPGDLELYNVADDPAERTNRIASDADTAVRMVKALDAWMAVHGLAPTAGGAAREATRAAAPPAVNDRLRALGYVE